MIKKVIVKEDDVVISESVEIIKTAKKDEFIQVYLEDMQGLLKLDTKRELHVIAWLWKLSTYVPEDSKAIGNMVNTGRAIREIIRSHTGYVDGSIRNTITTLIRKKLLISSEFNTTYYLNPKYFFKGDLKKRVSCFKLSIKYNIEEALDEETNTKLTFYTEETN